MTFDPGLGSFKFDPGVVSPIVTTPPRVSGQDALKHVLDHVLCPQPNSSICRSLKAGGYVKISQVIGMRACSMEVLFLKPKDKETLQALQGPADWLAVTADMFAAYQGTFQPKGWFPSSDNAA